MTAAGEDGSMNAHEQLITHFYQAFQRRDAAAMVACYHADVHFSDPVFPDLRGAQAGAMWTMLCSRAGADFRLQFADVKADAHQGSAAWQAWYSFSGSGRQVHNLIRADFAFQDGLIVSHRDSFNLHRWAAQALGPMGTLLGWTPLVQNRIRTQAAQSLAQWTSRAGDR